MSQKSGLTVRQFARTDIDCPVEFVVASTHREQVRFSGTSNAPDRHGIHGRSVDISPGGMGIIVRHFVPRMCEGVVRIVDDSRKAPAGVGRLPVLFEQDVKVRRIVMTSHEPTYFIGLAFVDPAPDLDRQISLIIGSDLVMEEGTDGQE